ncbi:hypothetical protein Hanom_Chr11g01033661 [Helianthus anomalus]
MVKTLIYRKYQRRIHHVLTTLHLFHISCNVTLCALPYTVVHSMVLIRPLL